MVATYHSVIGTVKIHGCSIWNFIRTFFKNIFDWYRDYVNMLPDKITLATGQCKIQTNLLTKLYLEHSHVSFQRGDALN